MIANPYLSVVVATRNDDHGGDPLRRLQAFVNTFAIQCRRTGLDAEVIVVEWNPPAEKPRVSDLLRVPPDVPFAIRFVEVPPSVHQRLRHADVLPLFQMIAKNVGVRRARGRFVLATNIDIIFSNELVQYLASRSLEAGRLYRVDRHDIEPHYPIDAPLDVQMAYCETHQLRRHVQIGTYPVDGRGVARRLDQDVMARSVTLGSGWFLREGDATSGFFRWARPEASFTIDRAAIELAGPVVLDVELEPNSHQPNSWVEIELLDRGRTLLRKRVSRRLRLRAPLEDGVAIHEIVLRVLDSSGGRDWLPLLESRGPLVYAVRHIGLTTPSDHVYDVAAFERANSSPHLIVDQTKQGVAITTDPGNYSYCVRYGPYAAPADGVYEFLLERTLVDGDLSFNALDDASEQWLAGTVVEVEREDGAFVSLSLRLTAGTRFSLVVSNNRHAGGASRFVLTRLLGSVPRTRIETPGVERALSAARRATTPIADRLSLPYRWVKAALSGFEHKRAQRFHSTITDNSPRVQELERQVAAAAQLKDLAPLVSLLRSSRPAPLFQNASGDFQLMAREHWFALRGYPELEMFSMGLDGVFEAIACAAGIAEDYWPPPRTIYHLEHEKGSGWTPEGEATLRRRIDESGITWLDNATIHVWMTYMHWLGRPMIFNSETWGFADVELPERILSASPERSPA